MSYYYLNWSQWVLIVGCGLVRDVAMFGFLLYEDAPVNMLVCGEDLMSCKNSN